MAPNDFHRVSLLPYHYPQLEQNRKREVMMEEQRVENWLITWNETQVTRADEHRKYLEQCLHPRWPMEVRGVSAIRSNHR